MNELQKNTRQTTPARPERGDQADTRRAVLPAVDVFEDPSGITLVADMPGVSKDKLELRLDGDALHIEGAMEPLAPEGLEAVYAEVNVPVFRRTFTLSRELDASKIDANLKDGVLTVRIPKQEHAQPRRIPVTAN
jgi:HSP20 family molecular chaperone IbpA